LKIYILFIFSIFSLIAQADTASIAKIGMTGSTGSGAIVVANQYNGVIGSVNDIQVSASSVSIGGQSFPREAGNTTLIQDKEGKTYGVDEDGQKAEIGKQTKDAIPGGNKGGYSAGSDPTPLAKDKGQVLFAAYANQKYGFDRIENDKLKANYDYLGKNSPPLEGAGGGYQIPWKSVKTAGMDKVSYSGNTSGGYTLKFRTKAGFEYKPEGGSLNIVGTKHGDIQEIYAIAYKDSQDQHVIGKLQAMTLNPIKNVVYVVKTNTSQTLDKAQIKTYLDKVYDQAVMHWEVEIVDNYKPNVSLGTNGLDIGKDDTRKDLSEEMKALRDDFKKQGLVNREDQQTYYVFLVDQFSDPAIDGYFPQSKLYGFVRYSSQANTLHKTLAHELGHGAGNLEHPFVQYQTSQGSTPLLMDYSGGSQLSKADWGMLHNPGIRTGWKDAVAEGQGILNSNQICSITNKNLIEALKQKEVFPVLIGSKTGYVKLYKNCEVKNVYIYNNRIYLASFYYDGKLYEDAVKTDVTVIQDKNGKPINTKRRYDESKYHLFINSINKREGFTFPYANGSQLSDSFIIEFDYKKNTAKVLQKNSKDSFENVIDKEKCGKVGTDAPLSENKISYFYDLINAIRRGYQDNTYLDLYTVYHETLSKPFYIGTTTEFIEPYEWFEDMSLFIPSLKKNYTFKNIEIQKRFYNTIISPKSIYTGRPKNMWGQERPAVIIEDKDKRIPIVLIYTETDAERDLLYEYMTTAPPKDSRIALFVNGFMPDYSQEGGNTNVYTYDPYNYWGDFDDQFIERRKTYNVVYASGHNKISTSNHASGHNNISTSNHVSEANFGCSMQNCCTDENAYCFTDFDVQGTKGEIAKKAFQEAADKVGDGLAKNKYFKAFSYIVKLGCALKKPTTDCYLNTTPNPSGYQIRYNDGKEAAKKLRDNLKNGKISHNYKDGNYGDTIDVDGNRMGFAYAMGMIEQLQSDKIKIGNVYVIAPENAASGSVPSGVEEFWQYGSNEADPTKFPLDKQDGVAPQAAIKGINQNQRAYIPDEVPKGFLLSHFIGNYMWIFTELKTPSQNGYVKPRK
jgi:hypothetical protein